MEGGGHDEEEASSKKKTNSRLECNCKNLYPTYDQYGGKMAKIDTLFITKAAEIPALPI